MTMEQDQEQMQGALYVAVDDGNKIIAMERSRRGDEGFRALLDEFTDYAANCGAIPSVLFFDIRTTDAALLPRIEAAEHNYLLDPSTVTEKLDIRHAVTLKDLLYCYKYDLDPLAEGNCGNMLSTKADYRQFRNEGLPPVAREDLRRCRAVETERVRCSSRRSRTVGRPANATCSITPIVSSTPIWGLKPCACTRWRPIPTASGTR